MEYIQILAMLIAGGSVIFSFIYGFISIIKLINIHTEQKHIDKLEKKIKNININ